MLIGAVLAFAVALVLTPVVRAAGLRLNVVDVPNERSSHLRPTPRGGGIAIAAGIAAAVVVTGSASAISLRIPLIAAAVIALFGLADDLRGLPEWLRLLVQFAAGALVVFAGRLAIQDIGAPFARELAMAPLVAAAVTIFWLAGVTNAFNFMDGINGIAAVEAIVCGLAFAVLLFESGDTRGGALALAVAAAAAGFLPWNFPAGSIFMGDVGSAGLGFLLAALAVRASQAGVPFIAAALPLLPFLYDTAVTLAKRIARRERVLSAHRSHYYQLLTISGWGHTAVTLLWGGLAVISATGALLYRDAGEGVRLAIVAALLALHFGVARFAVVRFENR